MLLRSLECELRRSFSTTIWRNQSNKRQPVQDRRSTGAGGESPHPDQGQPQTSPSGISGRAASTSSTAYCLDLVRKYDHENYLCTLLFPNEKIRRGIFAVRAFNTEIATVRDQVTQLTTGKLRYAFWKDTIKQLGDKNHTSSHHLLNHPVLEELSETVLQGNVSKKWFLNMIESRENRLSDTPFQNLSDLESYSDQSVTSALFIILEYMNIKSTDVDHAASHLGKSIGLTNFIRGIPHNAQKRRVLVPQDILIKHKASQESFIRRSEVDKIQNVVFDLAAAANSHYDKAKSLQKLIQEKVSSDLSPFPLFLCGVPTKVYLNKLLKYNMDPFHPSLMKRNGLLPWNLFYMKLTRQYY